MNTHNLLRNAVHAALAAGFATTGTAAYAADDVAEQDKITVTGSRIQRIDIEGPAPVTVINREDIDASGDISVAEVLRGTAFNSFGSFKPSSGNSAQSQATVSLRGLGSNRTLVLLDGRRMAGGPTLAGSSQNLNTIPLAAVDRIEILRDGASAIYGSDAIAGVINVVLRKDFEGVHLVAGVGRPTRDGGDESSGSIVGGVSSARGNLLFALEHDEQGMIYNGQRDFSKVGTSPWGFPGSHRAFRSTGSSWNNLGSITGLTPWVPDPRCPDRGDPSTPDPAFDGSLFQDSDQAPLAGGRICRFNYARTSANEASIRKDSLFVNGSFEISDSTNFFARTTIARAFSFGRYAPAPFAVFMDATSPVNPYPVSQTNDNGTPGDTSDDFEEFNNVLIRYRNVPGGFRDNLIDDTFVDVSAGFSGSVDWFGGADWELAAQHSRSQSQSVGTGYADLTALDTAVSNGSFDIFNVSGNFPTGSEPGFVAAAQSFAVDTAQDNEVVFKGFDGNISFDLLQMENGPVPLVFGFEYGDEFFNQDYDAKSNSGTVGGTAGGQDVSGSRTRSSAFAETLVPLLGNLSVNVAARYDNYSDFGTTFNPKVSIEFRPADTMLFRAGYGTGFRAPDLEEINTGPAQSFNDSVDLVACEATGQEPFSEPAGSGHPCAVTQFENYTSGNQNLDAEESDSWNVGFVWNPTADFSTSIDYYSVEFEGWITPMPLLEIFSRELAGTLPPEITVDRSFGAPVIRRGLSNLAGQRTDGIDLNIEYTYKTDSWGTFAVSMTGSHVLNYETRVLDSDDWGDTLAGIGVPDIRAIGALSWSSGDFGATFISEHIGDSKLSDGQGFGSSTWHSIQFTYDTPWNGRIIAGARNLFDKQPPLSAAVGHPFYDNTLYDVYGRIPYVRYEQDL